MPFLNSHDLRLYYEIHGVGPPLVLLNGALDTIESDWGLHLPAFAAHFRVLAYDHRGHGRSTNPSGRFESYAQLADDCEALLDALGIANAHFCGFSDGAVTLLTLALRRPQRVRSLIFAGAQYTNDARSQALLAKMTPKRISERQPAWATRLEQLHDTHHAPGYWQELLRQMLPMWQHEPQFTLAQLATIAAPTLLIAGERDGFGHIEQQLAMRGAFPNSELCIAPRASHFVMNDQPELFRLVTLDFLRRMNDEG